MLTYLCRIIQNLEYLLKENPTTHILVVGLLPRGSWQDPKDMFKLPSAFSTAIRAVNRALDKYAFRNKQTHFIDCSKHFVRDGMVSVHNDSTTIVSTVSLSSIIAGIATVSPQHLQIVSKSFLLDNVVCGLLSPLLRCQQQSAFSAAAPQQSCTS